MKYFIFSHGSIKIYLAAFSAEAIMKEVQDKIFKRITEQTTITLGKTELAISPLIRYLKRHPGERLKVIGARPVQGDYQQLEYAVLDLNSFSISEDDTLSSELFFPQEELYKSLLTKDLDAIICPSLWQAEVKLDHADFLNQMGTLMGQALVQPVYKINSLELSAEENPWTENLPLLAREFRLNSGEIIDGRNPANILISFKRIA